MRWFLFALVTVHGLVHLMGFAKAFGLATLPQLTAPVSRAAGIGWLVAGGAMLTTAALLVQAPRVWWMTALGAVVLSQIMIVSAWGDAWFGTLPNLLILAAAAHALASQCPLGLQGRYHRHVESRSSRIGAAAVAEAGEVSSAPGDAGPPAGTEAGVDAETGAGAEHNIQEAAVSEPTASGMGFVSESDLPGLPPPVRRYLRLAGAVGRPRVHAFRASWRGRIRGYPGDPWMEFTAEQHNFVDEPARFFLMQARRRGLPVDVYHAYRDGGATMDVRLLSLFPVASASGRDLTRAETVTLLNDLCLLAPGALTDSSIRWETVDDRSARAHYTVGSETASALLLFDAEGRLADFVSEDRLRASPDGTSFTRQRWSTPVGEYRSFGPLCVASRGEGRWHPPGGEFTYIELELLDLEVNPGHLGPFAGDCAPGDGAPSRPRSRR